MFESLAILAAITSAIAFILPYLIIFLLVLIFRMKYFIVHQFSNDNVNLPEVISKIPGETVIKHAYSFNRNNQFYLTTTRIVFHINSLLRGKYFTRYFQTKSVVNTEIVYKNPYGWLIAGATNVLVGIIAAIKIAPKNTSGFSGYRENSGSEQGAVALLILLTLIQSGFFVLIWYFLKGFYLRFNNGKVSGLFCRSREGLEDILRRFDIMKFTNEKIEAKETSDTKDTTCISCKSVITLDAEDLKSDTFVCPICHTVNPV